MLSICLLSYFPTHFKEGEKFPLVGNITRILTMPLVGASSSHRSEYEPTCTTCNNPFTTEENIREISLESLQRSANSRSCEQCELLLRGTVLVFGEEYRKYANPNVTLNVRTGRLPGEDPRFGVDVSVQWNGEQEEKKDLKFWCPPGV
jgi:hypothetical protein